MARQTRRQQIPERDETFRDARNLLHYIIRQTIPGSPFPTPIQYEICDTMQRALAPIVFGTARATSDDRPEERRIIIEGLRGIAKSLIAQVICVWSLYWNPSLNILVLSASERFAVQFTTGMLSYIRGLPPLQWMTPREGQRESVLAFDVSCYIGGQHPSMKSIGIEGQITGSRGDIIIGDDIEVEATSATEVQREKLQYRVTTEFPSIRKPLGATILLGTPHAELSLYNTLAMRHGYTRTLWPARYPDEEWMIRSGSELSPLLAANYAADPTLKGKPTDERFNEYVLIDKEAEMARSGFEMQMMLNTALSDATRYPLKLKDLIVTEFSAESAPLGLLWSNARENLCTGISILGLTGDRLYRPVVHGNELGKFEGTIMSIDPAGMGKDAMGVCVTRLMGATIFCPLLIGMFGGFGDANLVRICQIAKQYGVRKIVPEKNYGGGMFTNLLLSQLKIHYPECAIEEVSHTGQKEKRIIDTLEPVMNQHRLVFAPEVFIDDLKPMQGVSQDDELSYRFQHQLTRITRERGCLRHDDLVDALAMAVAFWTAHLANTTAHAQENVKVRNAEEMIQSWYRNADMPMPNPRPKIGHGRTVQRFIQRRQPN